MGLNLQFPTDALSRIRLIVLLAFLPFGLTLSILAAAITGILIKVKATDTSGLGHAIDASDAQKGAALGGAILLGLSAGPAVNWASLAAGSIMRGPQTGPPGTKPISGWKKWLWMLPQPHPKWLGRKRALIITGSIWVLWVLSSIVYAKGFAFQHHCMSVGDGSMTVRNTCNIHDAVWILMWIGLVFLSLVFLLFLPSTHLPAHQQQVGGRYDSDNTGTTYQGDAPQGMNGYETKPGLYYPPYQTSSR